MKSNMISCQCSSLLSCFHFSDEMCTHDDSATRCFIDTVSCFIKIINIKVRGITLSKIYHTCSEDISYMDKWTTYGNRKLLKLGFLLKKDKHLPQRAVPPAKLKRSPAWYGNWWGLKHTKKIFSYFSVTLSKYQVILSNFSINNSCTPSNCNLLACFEKCGFIFPKPWIFLNRLHTWPINFTIFSKYWRGTNQQ